MATRSTVSVTKNSEDYKRDRASSDNLIPVAQEILVKHHGGAAVVSSDEIDVRWAADLVVFACNDAKHAAFRVRAPGYVSRYGTQFTVRCARDGFEAELSKIERGFADELLYGFIRGRGLEPWYLIDLHVFRRVWSTIGDSSGYTGIRYNADGATALRWFDYRYFPRAIIIDSSASGWETLAKIEAWPF